MVTKPSKPLITALSKAEADVSAKSLTEEERVRMQTEWAQWAKEALDKILYMAIDNEEVARTLCATAALIATRDEKLLAFIKNALKKGNGRPEKWLPWMNKLLLIHYALAMDSHKGNHQLVRKELIDYVFRMNGTLLTDEAIENRVTKALDDVRQGKISLHDPLDWVQPIIQDRIKKGKMTKKLG